VFGERGEDSKTDNRVPHTLGEQIANSFHYDRDRLGFWATSAGSHINIMPTVKVTLTEILFRYPKRVE
jgi:hypothetical protein